MSELFLKRSGVFVRLCVAAVCLSGLPGSGEAAYGAEGKADGKKAFERVYSEYHGDAGEGSDGPPLIPPPHPAKEILNIARTGRGNMPPLLRATITDDEILAVVVYLEARGKEQ